MNVLENCMWPNDFEEDAAGCGFDEKARRGGLLQVKSPVVVVVFFDDGRLGPTVRRRQRGVPALLPADFETGQTPEVTPLSKIRGHMKQNVYLIQALPSRVLSSSDQSG